MSRPVAQAQRPVAWHGASVAGRARLPEALLPRVAPTPSRMPEKTLVVLGMEAVGKSLLVRRLRGERCLCSRSRVIRAPRTQKHEKAA
eukprot:SAG31_NODE_644_length_13275_cov_39.464633_10_plen_88_part_00